MLILSNKLKEECGIFGIYGRENSDVARVTYFALYALQHRGQESCGMAVNDLDKVVIRKDVGLVSEVFDEKFLNETQGKIAIGHVRYSPHGSTGRENAQPLYTKYIQIISELAGERQSVFSNKVALEFGR